jgi:hypothetical protein
MLTESTATVARSWRLDRYIERCEWCEAANPSRKTWASVVIDTPDVRYFVSDRCIGALLRGEVLEHLSMQMRP